MMLETDRPAEVDKTSSRSGMVSGQDAFPNTTASRPAKRDCSTPRVKRHQQRARRGVLGVTMVETTYDGARALVRAGYLAHADLENRDAIADAQRRALDDFLGTDRGGAHGSR